MKERLLTTKEVSEILRCNQRTVSNLRMKGLLIGTKIGKAYLYRETTLQKFIETYEGSDLSNTEQMEIELYMKKRN